MMIQIKHRLSSGYLANSPLCNVDLALYAVDILVYHPQHVILNL